MTHRTQAWGRKWQIPIARTHIHTQPHKSTHTRKHAHTCTDTNTHQHKHTQNKKNRKKTRKKQESDLDWAESGKVRETERGKLSVALGEGEQASESAQEACGTPQKKISLQKKRTPATTHTTQAWGWKWYMHSNSLLLHTVRERARGWGSVSGRKRRHENTNEHTREHERAREH